MHLDLMAHFSSFINEFLVVFYINSSFVCVYMSRNSPVHSTIYVLYVKIEHIAFNVVCMLETYDHYELYLR